MSKEIKRVIQQIIELRAEIDYLPPLTKKERDGLIESLRLEWLEIEKNSYNPPTNQ